MSVYGISKKLYCAAFTCMWYIQFLTNTCSVYFSCRSLIKMNLMRAHLFTARWNLGGNLPKPRYISRTSPNTSRQKIKGLDEALAVQPVWGANTCTQPWRGGRQSCILCWGCTDFTPIAKCQSLICHREEIQNFCCCRTDLQAHKSNVRKSVDRNSA